MKKIDIRFDNHTMALLQSFVGKEMRFFACRRLAYTSSVYGMVVFQIEDKMYWLTNWHETIDYMNEVGDVGVFKFEGTDKETIESFLEGENLTETPIQQPIVEIQVLNENQQLFHNNQQTYNVDIVRGLVFVMEDGREASFEKEIWYSELINVKTGHQLMNEFDNMNEFLENWSGFPEYEAKGSRNIIVLK